MENLKNYLNSQDKDYQDGVNLLKGLSSDINELKFFDIPNHAKMHVDMLINKLKNIYRVASQNPAKPEKQIQQASKPIVVKRMHFSEHDEPLRATKLLTNKLLSREWDELDNKERNYFNGNSQIFGEKKAKLIENSRIESELKTLHASLFHAKDDDERQQISERLVSLKKRQAENWSNIDNFEYVPEPVKTREDTAHIDKADLMQRRNNLRARISKAQKKSKGTNDPASVKKIEDLKAELAQVENQL